MSRFGDSRYGMDNLYDNIENFFDEGGTLDNFFEVLHYYFEGYELNKTD